MVEKLFAEVAPLYQMLHGYVRYKLRAFYGSDNVPEAGAIPVHLLGKSADLTEEAQKSHLPCHGDSAVSFSSLQKRDDQFLMQSYRT